MIGKKYSWLLVLSLSRLSDASTEFTIAGSGVTCSGDLQVDSLKIDCGGNYCTFGSDVNVQGSLTVNKDLETNTPKVTLTVANMVDIYKKQIDLCGALSSTDGSDCPNAGSYSIDKFQFKIPGDGEQWYAQGGYWGTSLALKATFDFGSSYNTVCTTSVTLSKNNGYQMVAGALAVLGLAAALTGLRRKRRVATIRIAEEEGTSSHFEMMPNDASARV